jgi:hypothetical protein
MLRTLVRPGPESRSPVESAQASGPPALARRAKGCSHGWSGSESCACPESGPRNPWDVAQSKVIVSKDAIANGTAWKVSRRKRCPGRTELCRTWGPRGSTGVNFCCRNCLIAFDLMRSTPAKTCGSQQNREEHWRTFDGKTRRGQGASCGLEVTRKTVQLGLLNRGGD